MADKMIIQGTFSKFWSVSSKLDQVWVKKIINKSAKYNEY